MNKRIDFSILGGFPATQGTLDFMQQSYRDGIGAIAALCGNKVIVSGVEADAGNVSAGWIVVDGELIPFEAGTVDTDVVILETAVAGTFADDTSHDIYYTKIARCGPAGDFAFAELERLTALQNIWRPGDLKMKAVDSVYEAANFDADGYGTGPERGWRIFSKVDANAAGKVMVNKDAGDSDFDTVGNHGGEKTHKLAPLEQGSLKWRARSDDGDGDTGSYRSISILEMGGQSVDASSLAATTYSSYKNSRLEDDANAHNNVQPFYVVLTLIKL